MSEDRIELKAQSVRKTAMAFIRQRPGITPERLRIALNVTDRVVAVLLARLEESKEVCIIRREIGRIKEVRVFAQGDQPKAPRGTPIASTLVTYSMPLQADFATVEPAHPINPITPSPLPKPMNPSPEKSDRLSDNESEKSDSLSDNATSTNRSKRRSRPLAEIESGLTVALSDLVAAGQPFTQKDVLSKIQLSSSFLNRHPEWRTKINQAIEGQMLTQLVDKEKATDTRMERMQAELEQLRQHNAELLTQNAELERKLGVSEPAAPALQPLEWLKAEADRWQSRLDEIEKQQKDAIVNLHAYRCLIALQEVKPKAALIEVHVSTAEVHVSTNGNGKVHIN